MGIVATLPYSLAVLDESGGLYSGSKARYCYALGGVPWMSGASREHPIRRSTAPLRKQQFDAAATPGEQSLEGWWLRSQVSFHGGAGGLYADPADSDPMAQYRFHSSRNVDVWTQGHVVLLPETTAVDATAIPDMMAAVPVVFGDGTDGALFVGGSTTVTVTASGATSASFTSVTSAQIKDATTDGNYVYVITTDGIYSAPIPATVATGFTWTDEYSLSGTAVAIEWLKSRLMVGVDNEVFEVAPHGVGAPLPADKYAHTDPGFVFTGFCDSAGAIYAIGNSGGVRGTVLKFSVSSTGTLPTLTGGATALMLPAGEVPYSGLGYLGAYVVLGTSAGVRVALANDAGDLTYGPLLFESSAPVKAFTARDRFVWCPVTEGVDGDTGLYRIDLSIQVSELRFAYASDRNYEGDSGVGVACSHLGVGSGLAFSTVNDIYVSASTTLCATGWLRTGRVRFSTLEPKLFKRLRVRGPVLAGALTYRVLDEGDHEGSPTTFPVGVSPGDDDVTINQPRDPIDYISLSFEFAQGTDPTTGAEFTGYQLKALPGAPRKRLLELPLMCYDFTTDLLGNTTGRKGAAYERLIAIEELERTGRSVVFQDLVARTQAEVVIEDLKFMQIGSPVPGEGWGGIITVVLRTV